MATIVSKCPCCDGPLFDREIRWLRDSRVLVVGDKAVKFSKIEARMFDCLWLGRERGGDASTAALHHAAYFDDPNGGAECASIVSVFIFKIRSALKPLGLSVSADQQRGAFYRLTGR